MFANGKLNLVSLAPALMTPEDALAIRRVISVMEDTWCSGEP